MSCDVGEVMKRLENEKTALDWNPQGNRQRERPKLTWKRTVAKEIEKEGKTWGDLLRIGLAGDTLWMPYAPARS